MFTGIIEEVGRVLSAQPDRLSVAAGTVLQGLELGGSIAVNGACLTVIAFDAQSFSVELMPETIKKTNLGQAKTGSQVNLERPLTIGKPLGGHLVQGHVDAVGKVLSIEREDQAMLISFSAPEDVMRYIVRKGFIAVDGASLTVVERDATSFKVSLVGFTRSHTTLGKLRVGDSVNLEADIIAKYVEQFNRPQRQEVTMDFLRQSGFV